MNVSEHLPSAASKLLNAVDNVAPFPLGIEKSRELAGKNTFGEMEFTFEHRGFLFAVRAITKDQFKTMQFRAHLGNLPYTVESPQARVNAYAVVIAAGAAMGGRLNLTSQQQIMIAEDIAITQPLTPALLISMATNLIITADPYLELLSMIITPPAKKKFSL